MANFKRYITTISNNPHSVFSALIQRLRRVFPIDYLMGNGYSFPPELVIILPTKRCNFFCAHCAARGHVSSEKEQELSISEFCSIIDKISVFKPYVYFSGGEPFLRNDIFELVRYIKKKKLVLGAVTNGSFFTDNLASKIVNSGIDFLGVSIDGEEKYHDKARGYSGAYASAVKGLRGVVSLRSKLKLSRPLLKITCIIDENDIGQAYHVLKLANDIGVDQVDFGYRMFYLSEVEKKQESFINDFGVGGMAIIGQRLERVDGSANDLSALRRFSKEAKILSRIPVSLYDIKEKYDEFYSGCEPSKSSVCKGAWFNMVVNPDGSIEPCQGFKVGNILREDFSRIWNGNKMKDFRRIRRKKLFPACFRCIEGQELRFD